MRTSGASLAMRVGAEQPSTIAAPAAANEFVGALTESVVEVERMIASFTALRAELIDTARQAAGCPGLTAPVGTDEAGAGAPSGCTDIARRSFLAEIATSLRISERAAENMIAVSEMLTHSLPSTFGRYARERSDTPMPNALSTRRRCCRTPVRRSSWSEWPSRLRSGQLRPRWQGSCVLCGRSCNPRRSPSGTHGRSRTARC